MSAPASLEESYEALHEAVIARALSRDVVRVFGPDARAFLQGQASQDLSLLGAAESVESLLLSPQGKFEAYVRIASLGEELFLVESESGWGEVVFQRLRRFKLRVKVTLELEQFTCLEVRGPKAPEPESFSADGGFVARVDWPGLVGFDVVSRQPVSPGGIGLGDPLAFEAARIEAGWPRPGLELNEKTIPQEAGLAGRTVSFTKGCYTGQELVARLDARGNNVARRLRGLRLAGEELVEAGEELSVAGRSVGQLTSAAYSPGAKGVVALCYLRRDVVVPSEVVLASGRVGEAAELPLL